MVEPLESKVQEESPEVTIDASAADEWLGLFASDGGRVVGELRSIASSDPRRLARIALVMASRGGRPALAAVTATFGVVHEIAGDRRQAVAAWTVTRSEAIDAAVVDEPLVREAHDALGRLSSSATPSATPSATQSATDGEASASSWPLVSRSVRDAVSRLLAADLLPAGPDVAAALQEHHGHLGGDLLGAVSFAEPGDRRLPVLAWLAPVIAIYSDVEVIDTSLWLLALADRDPAVTRALRRNGCDLAIAAELARKPIERRHWVAHHAGTRLVVTRSSIAPVDDVTLAVCGGGRILLATVAGDVAVWDAGAPGADGGVGSVRPIGTVPGGDATGARGGPDARTSVVVAGGVLVEFNGRMNGRDSMGQASAGPAPLDVCLVGRIGDESIVGVLDGAGAVKLLAPASPERGPVLESGPLVPAGAIPLGIAAGSDGLAAVVAVAHADGVSMWSPNEPPVPSPPVLPGAAIQCVAMGRIEDRGVVMVATSYGVDLWLAGIGLRLAAIDHGKVIVHCDCGEVAGRPVLAITDDGGLVEVWDMADLAPITAAARPVSEASTAYFTTVGESPCLLVRTLGARAEVRTLALATVVDEVPEYQSDDVAIARTRAIGSADALGRDDEANAIAEIVTSTSVNPPLSVGLFGEWGEGKSYFMERIWKHVHERSERAKQDPRGPICAQVRQVRFNAWHYAEADLWASLVSELFEQLAQGEADDDQQQRSITALRAELVRHRKLKERLDAARALQRELDGQIDDQTLDIPEFEQLPVGRRKALVAVLGENDATTMYAGFRSLPSKPVEARGQAKAVAWALWRHRWLSFSAIVLVALAIVLVVVAVRLGIWRWGVAAAAALAPAIAAVTSVWDTARRAAARFDEAWASVRTTALDLASASSTMVSDLTVRREVAAAEVTQLEAEYERIVAAGQLAGLLEQRLKDGTYRSRLGLMSQIRRDFVEMADLLVPLADDMTTVAGSRREELPPIQRIVLYIDDLDRCPPVRVVEVLEAIHLLLAVRLFVVVVAVDPRWLLRALTAHYRGLLTEPEPVPVDSPGLDIELWRSTPIHFLEKIFQVPFTLSPLDRASFERLVEELVGATPSLGGGHGGETGVPIAAASDARQAPSASLDVAASPEESAGSTTAIEPVERPALATPPSAEELDPLRLHDDERAFVKLLGPPLVTTPRAAKRLVNSYGLLLALAGRDERARIVGPTDMSGASIRPHRAALCLLAAVVGAPDASPTFFRNLHNAPAALAWRDFLDRQLEVDGDVRHLATMLLAVTDEAAKLDTLAMPRLVGHWQPWVVPCGRLSFQTGRVVVRLGTHPR